MKLRKPEYTFLGMDLSKLELHSEGDGRTMVGYASAYDYPMPGDNGETVIMRPGVFKKTIQENFDQIQALYHHGRDPQIGMKPLGRPRIIQEDKAGLWTETPLAHTSYNDDIVIPLLADGSLRAMSVFFGVLQDDWDRKENTRYVEQAILGEFGPTPNPRNLGATAALHSLEIPEMWEYHWDGAAAMRTCSNAAEFGKIAFERSNDSDPDTAAHWALPHHPHWRGAPGNADSAGVAAALAALHGGRGGPPNLKQSVSTVEAHLQAHQSESSDRGDRSTDEAAASPSPDRLNWLRNANRTLEQNDEVLAATAARIAKLKER